MSSSSSSTFSYATCWVLVHAYATSHGKVEWNGRPHHTIKTLHFVLFHSVTCYTNSIISCIPVDTMKLCNVTCTSVERGVILRSWECSDKGLRWDTWIKWSEVCADVDRFVVLFFPFIIVFHFRLICVFHNWIVLGNMQQSIDRKPCWESELLLVLSYGYWECICCWIRRLSQLCLLLGVDLVKRIWRYNSNFY